MGRFGIPASVLALIVVIYLTGPVPKAPELDSSLPELPGIEGIGPWLHARESAVPGLKSGNEARIFWAREAGERTTYSLVYLHGFSASPAEGRPADTAIARRYGMNLYEARLYGHGLADEDAFLDLTADHLAASATEALAIGKLLGDSVILMGCSTGGTLALWLAAGHSDLHSLILYAPNVAVADPAASLLTRPWGLQLGRLFMGGKHYAFEPREGMDNFWTSRYRIEGLIQMKMLVDHTMKPGTFGQIDQPVFAGYYYANEKEKDDVVSVSAIRRMMESLSTPENRRRIIEFPEARTHVVQSSITSKDAEGVLKATAEFCEEVLGLKPVAAGN